MIPARTRSGFPAKGLETSQSEITVPLVYHERVIGIIDVQSEQTGAFDQHDVAVLEALAGPLAVAIENVRLMDENRRKRRLAETLSHISRLASALLDVEQVSQTILGELEQLIEFDAALVALYENKAFRVIHQIGYGTKDARSLRWLVEESPILYRVVNQREPIWIADTDRRSSVAESGAGTADAILGGRAAAKPGTAHRGVSRRALCAPCLPAGRRGYSAGGGEPDRGGD